MQTTTWTTETTTRGLGAGLAAAAVLLAACGDGGEETELAADTASRQTASDTAPSGTERARTVEVGLSEYRIEMPDTLRAGPTLFRVTNRGTEEHNFEIESEEMEEVLDAPLAPGESAELEVDLEAGTYEVYCPVEDHADRGMRLELRVTELTAPSY